MTTATTETEEDARLGWKPFLLIVIAVAVSHTLSPSAQVADSRLSVPVATAVMRDHTLNLNGIRSVRDLSYRNDMVSGGADGDQLLPFFPWPPMLFALPGVVGAWVVGSDPAELKPSSPNQTWIIEVPTASVIVALTAAILAVIAFDVTSGDRRQRRRVAIIVALVFAFGTAAWSTGSRALWQHTPSMLFLSLALLCGIRIDRHRVYPVLFGATVVTAVTMRPSDAAALVVLFVWLGVCRRRHLLEALAGAAVVALPFVAVNRVAYGALLPPYYDGARLGTEVAIPFWEALAVYLVSPSRGLLVYDPILVLSGIGVWLKARQRSLAGIDIAVAVIVVLQLLIVGRYGSTVSLASCNGPGFRQVHGTTGGVLTSAV